MTDTLRVEDQWPELFVDLGADQRRAVIDALVAGWHEGWVPNREDVENLTDRARGAIDRDEYMRRVRASAERHRKLAGVAVGQ